MRNTLSLKKKQKARAKPGLLALAGLCLILPGVAGAQSSNVTNRLNRIENELETLSRTVYRGEAPPPRAFSGGDQAGTEVRIQQLETDLRDLRGRIEEQNYQIQQMNDRLDRALNDMEMRMGDVEGSGAAGSFGAAPQQPNSYVYTTRSGGTDGSVEVNSDYSNDMQLGTLSQSGGADPAAALYEDAFSQLKAGQYASAADGFEDFINRYPDHVLVSNAKYWLGETHYVRGNYQEAARIFAEGYQKFPKGSKAPDNLLKLGMSLASLGKKEDACVALEQVEKDFPNGAAPVLRRARQELDRLDCV